MIYLLILSKMRMSRLRRLLNRLTLFLQKSQSPLLTTRVMKFRHLLTSLSLLRIRSL